MLTSKCMLSFHQGFESGESGELQSYGAISSCSQYSPVEHLYRPATSYWVDEYSLYHSALIYPPPCLEPSTAFSDPYLRQTSRQACAVGTH